VDDCSHDQTADIVGNYALQDSRIRFYKNHRNLGDYNNRNKAASYAQGKYLKYLDSDDIMYSHCLTVMVDYMELFEGAGLGLSSTGRVHSPQPTCLSPKESYLMHFCEQDLFGRAPGSSIITRRAFELAGGFSGETHVGDLELWLKLAARFPLVTLPRDLVWDRVHDEQESTSSSQTSRDLMRIPTYLNALERNDCALVPDELQVAIAAFKTKYAKFSLNRILRGGMTDFFSYRRALKLEYKDYIRVFRNV